MFVERKFGGDLGGKIHEGGRLDICRHVED